MIENEIIKIISETISEHNLSKLIDIDNIEIKIVNNYIVFNGKYELAGKDETGVLEMKYIWDKTFTNYFKLKSRDRQNDQGIIYSFKKSQHVKEIIETKKLYLPSLNVLLQNDPLEYLDFINITNPFGNNTEFDKKDNIFIYCFTKDFRKGEFWNNYGINKKNNKVENIAVGFRFHKKTNLKKLSNTIELRDVIYNLNNEFDFIRELQTKLFYKFKKILYIDSCEYFARYFKREKYNWENEIRLCVDYNQYEFLQKHSIIPFEYEFENLFERKDKYIYVPMDNELFSIEICELICGKDISDFEYESLSKIAKERNILIWKYE